jgi:hypothetical protein
MDPVFGVFHAILSFLNAGLIFQLELHLASEAAITNTFLDISADLNQLPPAEGM